MNGNENFERMERILDAQSQGIEDEEQKVKIIGPEKEIIGFIKKVTTLRENGGIESKITTGFKEFSDGVVVSSKGEIVAVRCFHCKKLATPQNIYRCARCGGLFCRRCVKQKGIRFFCCHCWKIISFFPSLQRKYRIDEIETFPTQEPFQSELVMLKESQR